MLIHEQVRLPGGVEVDVGMAALIDALWALGLRTSYSCQGTTEPLTDGDDASAAYVSFPNAEDALAFFDSTVRAVPRAEHLAQIEVSVRFLAKPTPPGVEPLRRGRAVTVELSADITRESGLKGCVRFNGDLLDLLEDALRQRRGDGEGAHHKK